MADKKKVVPLENRLKPAIVSLAILIEKVLLLNSKATDTQSTDIKHNQNIITEEAIASIRESCRILTVDPAVCLKDANGSAKRA